MKVSHIAAVLVSGVFLQGQALGQKSFSFDFSEDMSQFYSIRNNSAVLPTGVQGTVNTNFWPTHGVYVNAGDETQSLNMWAAAGVDFRFSNVHEGGTGLFGRPAPAWLAMGAVGSSYTLREFWSPWHIQDTQSGYTAVNEVAQIGLINNPNHMLGDPGSLYVNFLETSSQQTNFGGVAGATGMTGDLRISNGYGSPLVTLATGMDLQARLYEPNAPWKAFFYLFDISFTNAGAGVVDYNLSISQYAHSYVYSEDTMEWSYGMPTTLVEADMFTAEGSVNYTFGIADRQYPALGAYIADSAVVGYSGAVWDWDKRTFPIPEPGSMALLLLSATAAMGIRRRR